MYLEPEKTEEYLKGYNDYFYGREPQKDAHEDYILGWWDAREEIADFTEPAK